MVIIHHLKMLVTDFVSILSFCKTKSIKWHMIACIKMSDSECSQGSRINMHIIKNETTTMSILHITELVNTLTKQPYHIDIFIS